MAQSIKLAEYLFTRLRQLQVDSIHGVPGDYNLPLLDYVVPQGLKWVGNCNELNAGYAADAYSRVKGLGALITTYGVGELSAMNAIACAYAELAPVVHIVGTPARRLQESRALIHHTLNDGEYRNFALMAKPVTVAQVNLIDPRICPQLIDDAIQQCLIHSRPVYIELPVDMVSAEVSSERLKTSIEIPAVIPFADDRAALDYVLARMYKSQHPVILVDGEVRAYKILDEIHQLIKSTGWPTWTTIFGKGLVDESLPNVHGIWKGTTWGNAAEKEYFASADLILCFGPHFSATNSYAYTSIPDEKVRVLFKATSVSTATEVYRDVPSKHFLGRLLEALDASKLIAPTASFAVNGVDNGKATVAPVDSSDLITQDLFYPTFNQFLRPGDVVLAETGTAGHGCREFKLPPRTTLFKPSTWLSIGYMLPATQGAALAQRELHESGKWPLDNPGDTPRTILLIGDGSFQMTVQELSTIIREKLNVLIILINNDGYTIERCLHGYEEKYNDIAHWRYLDAPSLFGASFDKKDGYHATTGSAKNWKELYAALEGFNSKENATTPTFNMIEVFMGREDAPPTLSTLLQAQKDAKVANGK